MTPTEPSADLRTFASFCHQMYVALTNEGFTQAQAMSIIGTAIASSLMGGNR